MMSHEPLSKVSFEELLERARTGETSALSELFRRSKPTLDKWASRRRAAPLPGDARPSDISQDLSVLVLRGFSQFQGSTAGEWFSWLKKISRNQRAQSNRDASRKKRDAPLVSLDSDEAIKLASLDKSPSQLAAHREEWHRLYICIYQLPEDQEKAITLHHLKDLPVAAIARAMGRTEASVYGLLHRGWKQIEARMKNEQVLLTEDSQAPLPLGDAAVAFMAYLRRRDAGERMDPEAFVAEHPTCANELRDMLHWIERLNAYRPESTRK